MTVRGVFSKKTPLFSFLYQKKLDEQMIFRYNIE